MTITINTGAATDNTTPGDTTNSGTGNTTGGNAADATGADTTNTNGGSTGDTTGGNTDSTTGGGAGNTGDNTGGNTGADTGNTGDGSSPADQTTPQCKVNTLAYVNGMSQKINIYKPAGLRKRRSVFVCRNYSVTYCTTKVSALFI